MIFRFYDITDDGNFLEARQPEVYRSKSQHFIAVDSVFEFAKLNYFVTLQIEKSDDVECNMCACLHMMVLLQQVKYFLSRGWLVQVVDLDDITSARIFYDPNNFESECSIFSGYLRSLSKAFGVTGFTSQVLYVGVTDLENASPETPCFL